MEKYIVKTPVKDFTGVSWGLAFVGGKSIEFEDKALFDKLVNKGYKGEIVKEKAPKKTGKKELAENSEETPEEMTE